VGPHLSASLSLRAGPARQHAVSTWRPCRSRQRQSGRPCPRPDSQSEAVVAFPLPTVRVRAFHAPITAWSRFTASTRVSASRHRFLSALAAVLTSLPPPRAPVAGRLTSLHFSCRSPSAPPPPPSTFLVAAPLLGAGEPHSDRSRADRRGDAALDLSPPDTGAVQPEPLPTLLAVLPPSAPVRAMLMARLEPWAATVVGRDPVACVGHCRSSCMPRCTAPLGHGRGIGPLALLRHFFLFLNIFKSLQIQKFV
jgi:hypothetical protein